MSESNAIKDSRTYGLFSNGVLLPLATWGRLQVEGLEHVPREGPLLLVANHDSQMDPIMIGIAVRRARQLRFLSRAELWRVPGLGRILTAMNQIPIARGAGDSEAIARAVETLRAGQALCVFPEGTLSRGRPLRARTGVARLAAACPDAAIVLAAVEGTPDFVGFPLRPRVSVRFSAPRPGGPRRDGDAQAFATWLLDQIREQVPQVPAGRRRAWSSPRSPATP